MFSGLVYDYLSNAPFLRPFYSFRPDLEGVRSAIAARRSFNTDRNLIHQVFSQAYANAAPSVSQQSHIELLKKENAFTVVTAHQPNIFTGYLYFIYKTVHTIVLSRELKKAIPECHFIPVFYIGSEDNDLDELSKFSIHGKPYRWQTDQRGAVGRMKVDDALTALIGQLEKELAHLPFAEQLLSMLRKSYFVGNDIAAATFGLLNDLFREEGLLVLQPDLPQLKAVFASVMKDDLLRHIPFTRVESTNAKLSAAYKVQVNPRNVNLFYLRDGIRNRIDKRGSQYAVDGTAIRFSEAEILAELEAHPERFSPNVILRGLYQETILPNIIFVGGGSELAYWMELKSLFDHYHVPFPQLVLRNSFLIMDFHQGHKMKELGIEDKDLFLEETALANALVKNWSDNELSLSSMEKTSKDLFAALKKQAAEVDKTLTQHVHALEVDHLKKLGILEKKMLKAERKKQSVQLQRIWKLKAALFPNGSLQERVDNFMPYYAQYGPAFIDVILKHASALRQEFAIIELGSVRASD